VRCLDFLSLQFSSGFFAAEKEKVGDSFSVEPGHAEEISGGSIESKEEDHADMSPLMMGALDGDSFPTFFSLLYHCGDHALACGFRFDSSTCPLQETSDCESASLETARRLSRLEEGEDFPSFVQSKVGTFNLVFSSEVAFDRLRADVDLLQEVQSQEFGRSRMRSDCEEAKIGGRSRTSSAMKSALKMDWEKLWIEGRPAEEVCSALQVFDDLLEEGHPLTVEYLRTLNTSQFICDFLSKHAPSESLKCRLYVPPVALDFSEKIAGLGRPSVMKGILEWIYRVTVSH
jgi:hypothetical protein